MNEVKEGSSSSWIKKYWWIILIVIVVLAVAVVAIVKLSTRSRERGTNGGTYGNKNGQQVQTQVNYGDPVSVGKELSHNKCVGEGSKKIGAPMAPAGIGTIIPMGLMVGGHVTPVDHEYYYQKNPTAVRDAYEVLAPEDGTIVEISHRGQKLNTPSGTVNQPSSDEYRFVISYSCTFFSYADLVTSVDPAIKAAANLDAQGNAWDVSIPVKKGQVIGRVGGQSLDFAVWDMTKSLTGLLVPAAYNNAEPWKIHTVAPLDYFTEEAKTAMLPFYVRTAEPRDGKIDYDVEGKLVGTWFQEGTNGYLGAMTNESRQPEYWKGHMTIAYDNILPENIVVSLGDFGGEAKQFAVTGNKPDPATVDVATGLVKYELSAYEFHKKDGTRWPGGSVEPLTFAPNQSVSGTLLVQMTEAHKLKMEVFVGKTASQVTAFDANAKVYTRGDGSITPKSNTAY